HRDGGGEVAVGEHGVRGERIGTVLGDDFGQVGVEHGETLPDRPVNGGADHAGGDGYGRMAAADDAVAGHGQTGVDTQHEHVFYTLGRSGDGFGSITRDSRLGQDRLHHGVVDVVVGVDRLDVVEVVESVDEAQDLPGFLFGHGHRRRRQMGDVGVVDLHALLLERLANGLQV